MYNHVVTKNNKKQHHHHGDLREALIDAGIDLLNEGGLQALTLRKCAARAGVSHAAPAHHFRGMKGLTTAIISRGYRQFTNDMNQAIEAADDAPFARLIGCCMGYIKFARENEALYNLLFAKQHSFFDDPECIAAGGAAYKVLIDICAPFKHNAAGARITETAVWALLHGFSSFAQFGVIEDASNLEKSDATLIDTNEYENIKLRIQDLINMLNLEVS